MRKVTPGSVWSAFNGLMPGRIFWISLPSSVTTERVRREVTTIAALAGRIGPASAAGCVGSAAGAAAVASAACAAIGRPKAQLAESASMVGRDKRMEQTPSYAAVQRRGGG